MLNNFIVTKDPDAILDYTFDWSAWLGTDAITQSIWLISGGDNSLAQSTASNTETGATIWLSGGSANRDYTLTNRITTVGGRTDDRSATIQVRDR